MKVVLIALVAIIYIIGAVIFITADVETPIEFQRYCNGVENQEYPDFKNQFHNCQYYGIRINSQCRAVSVGNTVNPEYILYCKNKKPLRTNTISMKEFQKP
jgi:hypothetical protein